MLEELLALGHKGAEYDAWLIRIDGDQFGSGFVAVNPNSKIPALMDRSGPEPIRVFESGAILMHLAEKFGAFLPAERAGAGRMPVMAVLADGQRAVPWRRFWPLLCLRADQDRICDRPLRDGSEAPARRARPAACRQRISRRSRLYDRRHGGLAVVRRAGKGTCLRRGRIPVRARIQERAALDRHDRKTPGREARPHGQPHLRRPRQPVARAPRRQRFRDQDAGQDRGGPANAPP